MSNKDIEVYAEALKRKEKEETDPTRVSTRELTYTRDKSLGKSRTQQRDVSRGISRKSTRELPTRDEIQEFSFRLRDELKVKVQAEVPHQWQDELDEISRQQHVKKLELYRFIFGEFLGKVRRKKGLEE